MTLRSTDEVAAWFGEVTRWPLVAVKYLLQERIADGPHETPDFLEQGRPFLSVDGIQDGELTFEGCRFISENQHFEFRKKAAPRIGDILFGKAASTGKIARVKGDAEFSIWSPLALLRPNQAMLDSTYFEYVLKSQIAQAQVDVLKTTNTQSNISMDAIPRIRIPLPPLSVQRLIAAFLVKEAARFGGLIRAKERVLELLAEKRRAIITRAVTRGLEPRVPILDSGIPWLGEIPTHWETRRVAWLFRERDERGEPDLPLLEVSINAGVVLREFSKERIESTAADFNTYKVARRGDVVFNKMRMWQGAVGVAPQDGLVSSDYVVAALTGPMSPQYAGLLFRTGAFSAECARRSHGIVWDRLRLYWDGFREIELPLPSVDDQADIVTRLGEEAAKLDALRSATERTIGLLKERLATLIAAVVTGRVDVSRFPESLDSAVKETTC